MNNLSLQILRGLGSNVKKTKTWGLIHLVIPGYFYNFTMSHPPLHNIFEFIKIFSRVHWAEAVWRYLARQMALLPSDKIYLGPASSTPRFRGISMKYS